MSEPQAAAGDVLGALDVSIDLPLATPASRSLAWFIDELMIVFIALTALLVGSLVLGPLIDLGMDPGMIVAGAVGGWFLLEMGWFALWEAAAGGTTPGKRWMGLRVVRRDGRPVGLVGAITRNLLRPIDQLPGGFVGLASATLSARHQRLGDYAAGTMVIQDREPEAPRAQPTRWPDGIADDDVALVEAYFDRAEIMADDARDAVAEALLGRVDTRHPGFVDRSGAADAADALGRAFGVPAA